MLLSKAISARMPNKDSSPACIDIREDDLLAISEDVLDTLLRDHTTGRNIFWATHDYEALGSEYDYHSQILPHLITGEHGMVIRPRVLKSKEEQTDRAKDMAEVFTPSWVCNAQNNLVDEAWWADKNKTWQDYVRSTRLEITCGEAPYLVSRYDATTGETIPLDKRIGLLDRKLRVICEHVDDCNEWLEWSRVAYQNIYGYEWQGDNLLLARKTLLYTFIEYYQAVFKMAPPMESINEIADIISWNLWQMDGLKGVVPDSCHDVVSKHKPVPQLDFFSTEIPQENKPKVSPCPGCAEDNIYKHNGKYCKIHDWEENKTIRFIDLIK